MSRTILKLTGADTRDFLQGLITNDVACLSEGLVYAAILSPQGKLMFDFFLFELEDGIGLDVASDQAAALNMRLNMYKLRADVAISETRLCVFRGTGDAPSGALADPRDASLGWRLYGSENGDDGSDWDALRVAACVPEWGTELGPDSYILEAGFDRLNGVNFRKGCYVGQEVTARMKHKTELRKGFALVALSAEVPVGTEITANGKPVGTVFTQAHGRGIAYLRLDRANGEMSAAGASVTRIP